MSQSVSGCVRDENTGETLTSPEVRLYRIGVPGEELAPLDEHGCFSFTGLSEGDYSLFFCDDKYVPQYKDFTLSKGETIDGLEIALKPGGFLCGKILDEKQQPPLHCHFTLIRAGERRGKSGYIDDSGDHVGLETRIARAQIHPERSVLWVEELFRTALE